MYYLIIAITVPKPSDSIGSLLVYINYIAFVFRTVRWSLVL